MKTFTFQTYKMFRLSRYETRTALDAFRLLKAEQTGKTLPYPVLSLGHDTCFKWQNYIIHIKVSIDESADYSWLGEWSDTPEVDAVPHEPGNHYTYNYFNPTYTVAEYQQDYSQRGYSRHESWLLAKNAVYNDYQRMLKYRDSGSPYIEVTASKQNVFLGHADMSTWDWEDIEETIINYGLIESAITEAQAKLNSLCSCF
ncbi:hypothetical protein HW132_07090 [Brasilonema sp. CT11]|nr:hypothetical protein [Brasilonema sp. CT11]